MSGFKNPDALVSTEWLAAHLSAPDVRVVDGSWYLPAMNRDPKSEFGEAHIPGAVHFDIDDISDSDSPLPHMLPSPEKFASRVRKLGLGDGNRIVVYDGHGIFSAPRVWWMFRYFGHEDVAVLDGGLPKWQRDGFQTDSLPTPPRERHFTARVNTMLLHDADQVLQAVDTRNTQIVDARPAGRYHGTDPEPRPGLRSGHIPGSVSLPTPDLIDPESGSLLPAETLAAKFANSGVDLSKPIVASCGSGVAASTTALALYLLGHENAAVYDGSWSEWGAREDLPIER